MIEIQDKEYLLNMYHKENEPFDSYNRMAYHGYEYDPSTGLTDEEMKIELSRLSEEMAGIPHTIQKARLFEFVLDHTRIDVNEHDYFIGLYSWSRIISPYTVHKWTKEIYHSEEEAY